MYRFARKLRKSNCTPDTYNGKEQKPQPKKKHSSKPRVNREREYTPIRWSERDGCRQCGWPHGPFENGLCRQCVRNGVNKGVYLDSRGQAVC